MFWFFKRKCKEEERIKTLEAKVFAMEQTMEMVRMSLHNLQSALIAVSKTQDTIGQDVFNIGEAIENIVNVFELDSSSNLRLVRLNPDEDLPN